MAFYFSNGLVSTIAYGDIVGQNYIEDIYVTILMVVSTVMVAFLLEEFMIMVEDNRFAIYDIMYALPDLARTSATWSSSCARRACPPACSSASETTSSTSNTTISSKTPTPSSKNSPTRCAPTSSAKATDPTSNPYSPLTQLLRPLALPNFDALYRHIQEVIYQPEVDLFLVSSTPLSPTGKG